MPLSPEAKPPGGKNNYRYNTYRTALSHALSWHPAPTLNILGSSGGPHLAILRYYIGLLG